MIEEVNTVIVGSGASGVAAALNFLKNGHENFLIIEALDRIGGRCHTIDYADSYLEMGAQWIHGQVDNPIFEYAAANKLLDDGHEDIKLSENDDDDATAVTRYVAFDNECEAEDMRKMGFYSESGEKVADELVFSVCSALDTIIRTAEKDGNKRSHDCSLKQYIDENFHEAILNSDKYKNATDETKSILKGLCAWRCGYEAIENGCKSLESLSLKYFGLYVELKGNQAVELRRGYRPVLDSMIESRDSKRFYSKLRLNHVLDRVLICENENSACHCEHCLYTTEKSKVVLLIRNTAENSNVALICNHVICTMSLGHLKSNFENIFAKCNDSEWFREKQESINRLGYGLVNKIYLVYDKPFWDTDMLGYQLVWLSDDATNEWYRNIVGFECLKNHTNILCAWIYGCEAYESLSDDTIKRDCEKILKKFLARDDIPDTVDLIRSKWHSNPYFCGSYSHVAVGSTLEDIQTLSKPIPSRHLPLINFAGEATHEMFYSTVHGAYLSGIRESQRILDLNKN